MDISRIETAGRKLHGLTGLGDAQRVSNTGRNQHQVPRAQADGFPRFRLKVFYHKQQLALNHIQGFFLDFVVMIPTHGSGPKFDKRQVSDWPIGIVELGQLPLRQWHPLERWGVWTKRRLNDRQR